MTRSKIWIKRLVTLLSGGILLVNSSYVFGAPMELSLDDSIALTWKNNPTIKMTEDDKVNSVWAVNEAKAKFGPNLMYEHSNSRGLPTFSLDKYLVGTPLANMVSNSDVSSSFSDTISVSVPLYTGGNLEGLLAQTKHNLLVADLEVKKNKQQLKLDTRIAYFGVLQAFDQLQVSQESLNNLTAHLKSVQVQYDEGVVNKADVLRSEVEVINAGQDLMKTKNNDNLAMINLKNVMGLPLDSVIKLKDSLNYQKDTRSLDECLKYALRDRLDIIVAKTKVDIAESGVKVAKSGNLPQVNFKGSENWNGDYGSGATHEYYWTLSLTASINVFDSGLTKSKVRQAESSIDKAQELVRQTKETANLEVNNAYSNLKVAEERIETSKIAVNKSQEAFRINEICYTEGVGRNLDVIDAQLALVKAKTNYNQALYDYNISKSKLDKAMGID